MSVEPKASPSASATSPRSTTSSLNVRGRRARRAARPLRLGQDDAAAHHRRARRSPTRASVRFDGEDAATRSARERHVGFVFQHYALFRHMTVFENVAFGLRVRRAPSAGRTARSGERVERLLELVQLGRLRRALSQPALRRPAPARGAGPRAGDRAARAAARRAVRRARRQGAQGAAPLAARAARRDGRHQPSSSPTTRRRRSRSPTAWW